MFLPPMVSQRKTFVEDPRKEVARANVSQEAKQKEEVAEDKKEPSPVKDLQMETPLVSTAARVVGRRCKAAVEPAPRSAAAAVKAAVPEAAAAMTRSGGEEARAPVA